eukprot:496496-Rhodomonas_salina.1
MQQEQQTQGWVWQPYRKSDRKVVAVALERDVDFIHGVCETLGQRYPKLARVAVLRDYTLVLTDFHGFAAGNPLRRCVRLHGDRAAAVNLSSTRQASE